MATLPSEANVGAPSIGESGRPIANFDATGYARGAAAIGQGVEKLGEGLGVATKNVAAVAEHEEKQNTALELARAKSDFLTQKVELDNSLTNETDHETLPGRYSASLGQIQQDAASKITNPRTRELFTLSTADDVARGNALADKTANKLWADATLADTSTRLEAVRQSALKAGDPADAAKLIQTGNDLISSLAEKGIITKEKAVEYRQEWTTKYAAGKLAMLPPDQRMDALRPAADSKDAVLDRIGGIENLTGNPAVRSNTSSAMGNFQFIKDTWLDTIKSHRPDLLEGRTEKQVLDLRADPKLSREMAGYLLDDNAAVLQKNGIDTSPANLYLAHFLGAETASSVLKAQPGTPVSDLVGQRAINANASVLAGKTTDSVIDWATRKMSAPGGSKIASLLPEDTRSRMFNEAQVQFTQQQNAALVDQQRADAFAARQEKMVSDQHENELLKQLYADPSKITAQSIVNNDNFTREAKERLTALLARVGRGDHDTSTYGSGFYDLFQRVHAKDGDPMRITDPAQLYSHVGPEGDLSLAGLDKLRQEISGKKTPDGAAEGEMKKQFLANAKGQISGTNEGLHIKDPKGDELYLKFMAQVLPAYDEGRKNGKSPAQLLNPDSPDYVGKAITTFKRPMAEWFADTINADTAPAKGKAFDIASIKSVDEAMKAYQSGQITVDQARALAVEKGWAKARPAPEERPQVPRF